MSDTITITGLVATEPRHVVTADSLTITSFRLASTQRRFDRSQEKWIDGETNWYTVTTFRQLAVNCAGSIKKGERVVVNGRLRIREWQNGERAGTTIEIEADSLGHDLLWGTSRFSRTISTSVAAPEPQSDEFPREPVADAAEPASSTDAGSTDAAEHEALAALPF